MSNQTSSGDTPGWRAMAVADLPLVSRIAAAVHPDLPESDAVFAERLRLFPAGCFVLATGSVAAGYAIAHPWRGAPPPLNTLLGKIPDAPDQLYIHDVALLPAARGCGMASDVLTRLDALVPGVPMRLVAVGGSDAFWRGHGFRAERDGPTGYGRDAVAMRRDRAEPVTPPHHSQTNSHLSEES